LQTWFCNVTYGKQLHLCQKFSGGTSSHAIFFFSHVSWKSRKPPKLFLGSIYLLNYVCHLVQFTP
jgi:hypothetical protein